MPKLLSNFDLHFETLPFEYDRGPEEQGVISSDTLKKMLVGATECLSREFLNRMNHL